MVRKTLVPLAVALLLSLTPSGAAVKKVLDGPLADDGRLALNHGAVYADGAVKIDASAEEEWHEYLVTNADKVVLAPKGVYRVSYDWELTKAQTGAEPYLYHLLRAAEPGETDRGWETFAPKAGDKGTQRFIVTLADLKAYRLIIGVHFGGEVKISKLTIEDLSPAPGVVFAPYFAAADERIQLTELATIANDGLDVDTTGDTEEWHEYLHSIPEKVALKSGGSYKISYDYKVTKALAGGDASFYHLVRTPDNMDKDKGMELWTAAVGEKGHKEVTVELEKADGYVLILGVRFKGGIRIENLLVEDLSVKK